MGLTMAGSFLDSGCAVTADDETEVGEKLLLGVILGEHEALCFALSKFPRILSRACRSD